VKQTIMIHTSFHPAGKATEVCGHYKSLTIEYLWTQIITKGLCVNYTCTNMNVYSLLEMAQDLMQCSCLPFHLLNH